MHEFGIADAILAKTLEISAANGGASVERVQVLVGGLRQLVPEMLEFAFNALAAETAARGAALDVELAPVRVVCRNCEHAFEPDDLFWTCPVCGTCGANAVTGDELILKSVTLADVAPETASARPEPSGEKGR
ncbi:MAG: hydrogenase maturation nickel metallochaperone HypA [Candidatus Hydrogenedentes bacterium]|nr:hydrogenase maturation nickel metallochaperone HypA [Candidatus Hydrogenedentota bacterium]